MSIQPTMDKFPFLSSSIRIERSNLDKEITNKISSLSSVCLNEIAAAKEVLVQGNIKATDAKTGETHANRTRGSTIFIEKNTGDLAIGGRCFYSGSSTSRGGKSSEASNTGCGGSSVFIGKNKGDMSVGGKRFFNVSPNSMNNVRPGTTAFNDLFSKNFAKHSELNIVSINVVSTGQSQSNQTSSKKEADLKNK